MSARVARMATEEKMVPSMAKIFLRCFCTRPPIPSPRATKARPMKAKISMPTTIASGDVSSMPPGVVASMTPATVTMPKINRVAMILRVKAAMPRPECLNSGWIVGWVGSCGLAWAGACVVGVGAGALSMDAVSMNDSFR